MMRIRYVNYRTVFPTAPAGNAFTRWFWVDRYSRGRLVYIGVRHHAIAVDLR